MQKPFTLVTTVFNEIKRLDQTIEDIENQTIKPDEILIADAGSTDGTLERLRNWKSESKIEIGVFVKEKLFSLELLPTIWIGNIKSSRLKLLKSTLLNYYFLNIFARLIILLTAMYHIGLTGMSIGPKNVRS